MTESPTEEPRLRDSADGASLIAAGTHCEPPGYGAKLTIAPGAVLHLADYGEAGLVRASFVTYLDSKWRPWAQERSAAAGRFVCTHSFSRCNSKWKGRSLNRRWNWSGA